MNETQQQSQQQQQTAETAQTQSQSQTQTSAQSQATESIQLTRAEYEAFLADRSSLTTLRQETRTAAEQAEQARLRALAERGESTQALTQQREQYEARVLQERERSQALERRFLERERALAINDALAGAEWVSPSAAIQARQLLEARFESVLDPGTNQVQVLDRNTRRPAADVAREWLGSTDASHFLRSKASKGTSTGGQIGGGGSSATDGQPLSYEQQVLANWQHKQASAQQAGWQIPIQRTLTKIG